MCPVCGRKFKLPLTESEPLCVFCKVPLSGYSKYRNRKVEIDGEVYDSLWEREYHQRLLLAERAGGIRDLRRQVVFELSWPDGTRICTYRADFVYIDAGSGALMAVDAKGQKRNTAVFQIKRKLMKLCHGIEIEEVRRHEQ